MLCSFDAKPLILRLYGRGEAVQPRDERWGGLIGQFKQIPGQRQIIMLHIESLQTSCGFGVPRYELVEDRSTLADWCARKGPEGIGKYWVEKNQKTIDGFETRLIED